MVSPNPAKTYTTFRYSVPTDAGNGLIEIRNMVGQLIHEIKLNDRKGETVWFTGNATPGVYIYILKTDTGTKTGKLVVTR